MISGGLLAGMRKSQGPPVSQPATVEEDLGSGC